MEPTTTTPARPMSVEPFLYERRDYVLPDPAMARTTACKVTTGQGNLEWGADD